MCVLRGHGAHLRQARRPARRVGARHHALLLLAGAPGHHRHAVRGHDDRGARDADAGPRGDARAANAQPTASARWSLSAQSVVLVALRDVGAAAGSVPDQPQHDLRGGSTGCSRGIHDDRFMFGSAGNSGHPRQPGDPHADARTCRELWYQPIAQGLLVARWASRLWFGCCAKSGAPSRWTCSRSTCFARSAFMAKGIPGFALPGLIAVFYLVATRRWSLLLAGALAHRARRARADRRHGPALVRRDVRASRARLHRSPADPRSHQPPGLGRARRHRQHPVLPVAARLRRVSRGSGSCRSRFVRVSELAVPAGDERRSSASARRRRILLGSVVRAPPSRCSTR